MAHEGEASEHGAGGGIAHLPAGAGAHNQHPRRLWMACEVAEVLRLSTGQTLQLAKAAGEPLDIFVNGRLLGRGEPVVQGDRYGVRITELVTPGPEPRSSSVPFWGRPTRRSQ